MSAWWTVLCCDISSHGRYSMFYWLLTVELENFIIGQRWDVRFVMVMLSQTLTLNKGDNGKKTNAHIFLNKNELVHPRPWNVFPDADSDTQISNLLHYKNNEVTKVLVKKSTASSVKNVENGNALMSGRFAWYSRHLPLVMAHHFLYEGLLKIPKISNNWFK